MKMRGKQKKKPNRTKKSCIEKTKYDNAWNLMQKKECYRVGI